MIGVLVRSDAILDHAQLEVPHIGIVGGKQHTVVSPQTSQDEASGLKMLQEKVERGLEESGVLRL
jgi:hypothetical protein